VKRDRKIKSPDIEALVDSHLRPGECVEGMHQDRPDKLAVFLAELDPETRQVVEEFGFGGCGRTLVFAYKSGRWGFVGEGAWRS
jgi:hypothetical protein